MPLPSDYNDAVQALDRKFKDPFIKSSSIAERDSNGIPASYSGNFACVYKIRAGGGMWALRFFININGQTAVRYRAIKSFLQSTPCPFFVEFDFQDEAVLVSGKWYPLVKMPWIDGRTLDKYVKDNLGNPQALSKLANDFAQVIATLKSKGIAHGDLQHGNIIVSPTGIKLIDYDGLYCAATKTIPSNEVGMPNYQHPKRTAANFGPNVDDFSAWIIFISLTLISKDSALFNDNDTLIFEKSDLESPQSSARLKAIATHGHPDVRALGGFIIGSLLQSSVPDVPSFSSTLDPIAAGANQVPSVSWWAKASPKAAAKVVPRRAKVAPAPALASITARPAPTTVPSPAARPAPSRPPAPQTNTTHGLTDAEYWGTFATIVLISTAAFATLPLLVISALLMLIGGLLGVMGALREILAWCGGLIGLALGYGSTENWVSALISAAIGAALFWFIGYACGQGAESIANFGKNLLGNWRMFLVVGAAIGCCVGVVYAAVTVKR